MIAGIEGRDIGIRVDVFELSTNEYSLLFATCEQFSILLRSTVNARVPKTAHILDRQCFKIDAIARLVSLSMPFFLFSTIRYGTFASRNSSSICFATR